MNQSKIRKSLEDASREELISIIELLLPLIDRVAQLEMEIVELKNKNSGNSSLPPSRDKQKDKKTRSLRKKSGRKSGGQPGHKGNTLKMSERVDTVIDYPLGSCHHCQHDISKASGEIVERKQVWDIPPVQLQVSEHRRYKKCCDQCGQWSYSQFDKHLQVGPPVRYGDQVSNCLVYLMSRQLVPYQRLTETFELLYGQKISQGTIDNMMIKKTKEVSDVYQRIIERIENSPVVGVDESGCSVKGKKAWAWTWVTPEFSLIHISKNRGYQTTQSLFPNGFLKTVLVSDCWRTHLKTLAKAHQLCLPHLRRECRSLIEFQKSKWARKMDAVLKEILIQCQKPRIKKKRKQEIEDTLNQLLARPLLRSAKPIVLLKKRLIRLRECITVCLYDRKVPPDNNASERAIRMIKQKVKISGTFRSNEGAERFAKLRTIIDSAIKQNIHPFVALKNPNILLNST